MHRALTESVASRRLRDDAEGLRSILDEISEMVCRFRPDGTILFVNRSYALARGVAPGELEGKSFWNFIPEGDRGAVEAHLSALTPANPQVIIENRFESDTGTIWTRWVNRAVAFDNGGNWLVAQSTGIDITERKRAEGALGGSELRYRQLVEQMTDGIFVADPDGRYIEVNPAGCAMLGMTREEVLASTLLDVLDPAEHERLPGKIASLAAGDIERDEWRFKRKDGSVFTGELMGRQLPNGCFQGVLRDITDRKRTEAALRESEERFRAVLANSPDIIYRLNARTARFDYISPAAEAIVGFSVQELMALDQASALAMIHPDDRSVMLEAVARLNETGLAEAEYRQLCKGGGYRWLSNSMSLTRDKAGRPEYRSGNLRDITERKRAEEALRATDAELELILTETPFMLTRCSRDLRYLYASRAYADMLGRTPDQVAGKPIVEVMGEEGFQAIRPHVEAVLQGQTVHYESAVHYKGAGPRFLSVAYLPEKDGQGQVIGWLASIMDITKRKLAEEQLRESEALLQAVLDGSLDPIFMKDREGRMVLANPATCAAIGKPAEFVLGKTDEEFLDNPADARAIMANDRRIMLTGEPETVEEAVSTSSGTRYYLNRKAPRRDAAGAVIGLISTAHDVTERKRAEKRLREHTERLAVVLEIQRDIAGATPNYAAPFESILERLARALLADGAALEIVDGDDLVYEAATGLAAGLVGLRVKRKERLSGLSMTNNSILRTDDTESDPRVDREACSRIGLRSMIVMPLRYDDCSFGVLKLMSAKPDAFGEGADAILRSTQEFLGVTIARQRAQAALKESEEKYRQLFESMTEGFLLVEPILDERGEPVSYRYLSANPVVSSSRYHREAMPRNPPPKAKRPRMKHILRLASFWRPIGSRCNARRPPGKASMTANTNSALAMATVNIFSGMRCRFSMPRAPS